MNKTSFKFQKTVILSCVILICLALHFFYKERAESIDEIKDLKHYKLSVLSYECRNRSSYGRNYLTHLILKTTSSHKLTLSTGDYDCERFDSLIPYPFDSEFEIYAKNGRIKQFLYDNKVIVSFETVKKGTEFVGNAWILATILIGCYKMYSVFENERKSRRKRWQVYFRTMLMNKAYSKWARRLGWRMKPNNYP